MKDADDLANDLIAMIYAALLGETSWQSFLDRLNAANPGALSTLFFHDLREQAGCVAFISGAGGRENALEQYERYYSSLNPWMKKVAATPIGRGIIGEELITREDFNRSEYYSDYIRRNGLETGTGLTLFRDNSCYFLLSMLTEDKDIDRNLERADVLTRIAPHLQRVFRYYRSGEFHAAAIDLADGIDRATHMGFILVNEDIKVVKASAVAEQALAGGSTVALGPLGHVRFRDSELQTALQALLNRGNMTNRTFIDPRSDIRMIRIGRGEAVEFFAGPMVAILLGSSETGLRPTPLEVAGTYQLSPAETRVFAGIISGRSITEIAGSAGVRRETVRTQLKSIFAKTGTASQADLVRLAAGMPL